MPKYNLLLLFFFCIFHEFTFGQTYTAKVIGISDGDTISILVGGKEQKIRLAHIDAPEKNQPYGKTSKLFLSKFIFNKNITIIITDKPDKNGRWIAEIFLGQKNINQELVRQGLAWHFKKYSNNNYYHQLEQQARKNKIGLWKESQPTAPWDWRKK